MLYPALAEHGMISEIRRFVPGTVFGRFSRIGYFFFGNSFASYLNTSAPIPEEPLKHRTSRRCVVADNAISVGYFSTWRWVPSVGLNKGLFFGSISCVYTVETALRREEPVEVVNDSNSSTSGVVILLLV